MGEVTLHDRDCGGKKIEMTQSFKQYIKPGTTFLQFCFPKI
jgi:hypothetical protein